MSRFDLFFVVLDECDEATDYNIAKHIVTIHQHKDQALSPVFSTAKLQRYIKYTRKLKPQLTEEAKKLLVEHYRKLRQSDIVGHNKTAYRITVRQLESMIRLSEALARIHCDKKVHFCRCKLKQVQVRAEYVVEAAGLLRKSIIHVETGDIIFEAPAYKKNKKFSTKNEPDADSGSGSDSDKENTTDVAPMQVDQPEGKKSEEPAKANLLSVSFEKYTQIVDMIIHHLNKDSPNGKFQILPKFQCIGSGEAQGEIISWYLDQKRDDFKSEEELVSERQLVKNIIHRLVTRDRVLLIIEEASSKNLDERILVVDPNYEGL
jgi:DNA replication licensing factor MCM6